MWVPTSEAQIRVIDKDSKQRQEKSMSQLQMYAAMSYQEARLEGYQRSLRRREGSRVRTERARRRETEASWK